MPRVENCFPRLGALPDRWLRGVIATTLARDEQRMSRLRENFAAVVDAEDIESCVRQGVGSYARYWQETIRAASPAAAARQVAEVTFRAVGPEGGWTPTPPDLAGAIVVLPHMGNWDLAATWGVRTTSVPIMTVVERVSPRWLFEAFLARRRRIGLAILPHDMRGKKSVLEAHLRGGGAVALICDRAMGASRTSRVQFLDREAHFPTGPAELAINTGARILPVALVYEGSGMVVLALEPIAALDSESVAALTQRIADAIGECVRVSPCDWHMMQRVFDQET
jgi:phosphatidylinositol dimannoside acyltransferase